MRFQLIDRIDTLEPGRRIAAVKNLTLAEEYLQEHFPRFPVLPGVLMVEALTQAAAWLVRATEDFQHSVVLLGQAKALKFGQFVAPGRQLRLECEWVKADAAGVTVKGSGTLDGGGAASVSGRLVLVRHNLADTDPALADRDQEIRARQRRLLTTLHRPGGHWYPDPATAA